MALQQLQGLRQQQDHLQQQQLLLEQLHKQQMHKQVLQSKQEALAEAAAAAQ